MNERRGEKVGWTVGWLGSFCWVFIFSVLWLARGRLLAGGVALLIVAVAVALIVALAPWRHPRTRQWKLLLPIFLVLAVSVAAAVHFEGGLTATGMKWWSFLWVIAIFLPLLSYGARCWQDGEPYPPSRP